MIGFLASKTGDTSVSNKDIYFIHLNSVDEKDIEIEAKPFALAFARAYNLKKVYLHFGEKGLITYGFKI